jgi:predicted transcriptional regulator
MKRTTIFADDTLIEEMKTLARQEKRSVAELVREAMEQYVAGKQKPASKLSFIGVGKSGKGNVAENSEDLLWQKS